MLLVPVCMPYNCAEGKEPYSCQRWTGQTGSYAYELSVYVYVMWGS